MRSSTIGPDPEILQERIWELGQLSNELSEQIDEQQYQTEMLERKLAQLVHDNV